MLLVEMDTIHEGFFTFCLAVSTTEGRASAPRTLAEETELTALAIQFKYPPHQEDDDAAPEFSSETSSLLVES